MGPSAEGEAAHAVLAARVCDDRRDARLVQRLESQLMPAALLHKLITAARAAVADVPHAGVERAAGSTANACRSFGGGEYDARLLTFSSFPPLRPPVVATTPAAAPPLARQPPSSSLVVPIKKRPLVASGTAVASGAKKKRRRKKSMGATFGSGRAHPRTALASLAGPNDKALVLSRRDDTPARINPRPQRQRFRPLAFWAGERVVYAQMDAERGGPFESIVDVVVLADDEQE